jgi:hypothetical protein
MTMPTPHVPGLETQVAELERRIRALEGADGAKPGSTQVAMGAWPFDAGDSTRWPRTLSTSWAQLYRWAAIMEFKHMVVRLGVLLAAGTTGQVRIIMNNTTTLWTSGVLTESGEVDTDIDLAARVANDSFKGSVQQLAIDAKVVSGTGGIYVMPYRLILAEPVW